MFFWYVMKDVKIAIGIFMIIIDCAIRALVYKKNILLLRN